MVDDRDPEVVEFRAQLDAHTKEVAKAEAKAVAEREVLRTIVERLTTNADALRAISAVGDKQLEFTQRELDLLSGLALKVQIIEAQIEAFTRLGERPSLPPPAPAEAVAE